MGRLLSILQHALGVDQFGCGTRYRDHFVAGPGHSDYETCREALQLGLMVERKNSHVVGGHIFFVTEAGGTFVTEHSPAAPKTSRAQRRYRAYLDHDSGLTFGEWLLHYGSQVA